MDDMLVFFIMVFVLLPPAVLFAGNWIMSSLSGRDFFRRRVKLRAAPGDRKPLNRRFGYDACAVHRHWRVLGTAGCAAERKFLKLDIAFPLVYGAALTAGMVVFWIALGRPFHPAWFIEPVIITMVADWMENILLLGQLGRYANEGKKALEDDRIKVANAATTIKLTAFSASYLLLVTLAGLVVFLAP